MILVAHRVNARAQLLATPQHYGVEVDIRSRADQLIVTHDAFTDGEDFEQWIEAYSHALLILNVKEEGLEAALLSIMRRHAIERFFFLDQSFPYLVKTAAQGERRCAVRVSEYESVATALALAGRIEWAWVDCFSRFPLSMEDGSRLRGAGFKLCLVSPELQGRHAESEIRGLRVTLDRAGIRPDAVCTKYPERWL